MKQSIWIGWDDAEREAWWVARQSLLRHITEPIPVHKLALEDLQARGLHMRPMHTANGKLYDELSVREDYDGRISTGHANARFFVPQLAGSGWALFMDGDILVRGDISRVFHDLDHRKAVYCVHHDYWPTERIKKDNDLQTQYARKNWSSFMLFNCDHASNRQHLTLDLLNSVPGRDLHAFCWLADQEIGALAPEWNYLVGTKVEPIIVHFTEGVPNVAGYEHCEYSDEWRAELRRIDLKDAAE